MFILPGRSQEKRKARDLRHQQKSVISTLKIGIPPTLTTRSTTLPLTFAKLKPVTMTLSNIERGLTKHVRLWLKNYKTDTLKKFALGVSLISCLCAGSVLLFPLFSTVMGSDLHYTQVQINIIGSFTSLGMYLPLPVLGYLADAHGPVILSVISMLFFSPSYLIASLTVQHNWSFWILAITFGVIGCATSSLYFTCLLTCAKMYPKSKGLTISAPVTCYGLSSLIGSQLLNANFLRQDNGELNLVKSFRFFAILYSALGLFNWVSSSVVSIERDVLLKTPLEITEETPLVSPIDDETSSIIAEEDLVPNHEQKFVNFLKDLSAYILLFSLLLSIGPSEMYITNMGSLVETVSPQSPLPDQVSIHAVFSTLSRLSLGALSDILSIKFQLSRVWLLLSIIILGAITQLFIATGQFKQEYYFISALSGFCYGGLFTLYPTIVLSIWGSEIFGSTWGSFMVAPAIGSSSFGIIYAIIYDATCRVEDLLAGNSSCISQVFWITTFSFILSSFSLVFAWRFLWKTRGKDV